jgi:hypothetical protein
MRFRWGKKAASPISDRLLGLCRDPDFVESLFAAFRFEAENSGKLPTEVLDLDDSSDKFCRRHGTSLLGDSLSLPVLLGLRLTRSNIPWPQGIYATGAIRHFRGFRCASVAGARTKIRLLEKIGYERFFVPRKNYRELRLAGFNLQRLTALPTKLSTCLALWDAFLLEKK